MSKFFFFVWRSEFCHQESHFNGVVVTQWLIRFKPRRYKFDNHHRYLIRKDHASNLRLNACLLFYDLRVRVLFKMKKTNVMGGRHTTGANFFSKANSGGREFL